VGFAIGIERIMDIVELPYNGRDGLLYGCIGLTYTGHNCYLSYIKKGVRGEYI